MNIQGIAEEEPPRGAVRILRGKPGWHHGSQRESFSERVISVIVYLRDKVNKGQGMSILVVTRISLVT